MGSFKEFVNEVEADSSPEELEQLNEQRQRFAVARQLRALRVRSGMTQIELSEATGITQPIISNLERGDANPTLETLQRLASVFPGVSVGFVEEGHLVDAL